MISLLSGGHRKFLVSYGGGYVQVPRAWMPWSRLTSETYNAAYLEPVVVKNPLLNLGKRRLYRPVLQIIRTFRGIVDIEIFG